LPEVCNTAIEPFEPLNNLSIRSEIPLYFERGDGALKAFYFNSSTFIELISKKKSNSLK
jgi:hypothetical protein